MKFVDLGLSESILAAVADEGYETATPIQAQTIPHTLAGRDVLGCAQTGTGKTAAFALPMLHRLTEATGKRTRGVKALVLAPTRELAQQIAESFKTYGKRTKISGTVIYGGVSQHHQVNDLQRGVDIVVATPGRLLDLINQGLCNLSSVEAFVLDEADRMLDMGFMPDIKRIISHLPKKKQTLLFSATMPREIRQLADTLLHKPAEVTVAGESVAVDRIVQNVYHVDKPDKPQLLAHLMDTLSISRAIVFTRTKHGADRVTRNLNRGGTKADAIHGDKSQNARRKALDNFRAGKVHVLVATDIAARGIDVNGVSHVFNYDLCRDAESHIHRIGRTARAGAEGTAISFCDREELPHLRAIERMIRMKIEVIGDQPKFEKAARPQRTARNGNANNRGNGQSNGRPSKKVRGRRTRPGNQQAAGNGGNTSNNNNGGGNGNGGEQSRDGNQANAGGFKKKRGNRPFNKGKKASQKRHTFAKAK